MHFVRVAAPLVAVLFVAFLSLPAAAQGSTATVALTVPAGPTTIQQGGNTSLAVKVAFTLQNVVCAPGPSSATVNLAVADPSPLQGIAYTLPSSVVFDLMAPMAYSQVGPFSGEKTVQFNVTVAPGTIANHEHTFNVTASFTAAQLTGCQASPAPGGLDASDSKSTLIQTGAGGPGTTGTPTGNRTGTDTSTEAAPALPLGIQIPVLLGLGILAIRRKQA